MNAASNHQLFAIIKTTMCHPISGKTGPHILGAIFDVDSHGFATDCTAVDFEGSTIRHWPYDNFGKSTKLDVSHIPAEKALFFPITKASADLIKEAMVDLDEALRTSRNPFYYASGLKPDAEKFERKGIAPVKFDGSTWDVSHTERLAYQRSRFERPRSPTNCMQFLQDVLEHVGGVPIEAFCFDGKPMPRDGDSKKMADFITELAGNTGKTFKQWNTGRLIDMGEGRKAYAYDEPAGWITYALNQLKHPNTQGDQVPLAKFLLEESAPFYDPRLNENNLGRGVVTTGHGR